MPAGTTQKGDLALFTSGIAGWVTPVWDLFTTQIVPTRQAVITDFTLAAYTGYAQVAATFDTPYLSAPSGQAAVISGEAEFNGPTAGLGTPVYGWVLHSSASADVYAWGMFDNAPLGLNMPTDRIVLDAQLLLAMTVNQFVTT
jgi:hypothetical protein